MIELKFDLYELKKNPHELLINIKLIEALRAAGIPVVGRLVPSAVEYGTMVWSIEEDLDGDTLVVQWFDRTEFAMPPRASTAKLQKTPLNSLRPVVAKPVIEDEEL